MRLAALSLICSLQVFGDDLCRKWVIRIISSTVSWTEMAESSGACLWKICSCWFVEDWWLANRDVMEEGSWTGFVVFPTHTPCME